jgi:hypothetical protein
VETSPLVLFNGSKDLARDFNAMATWKNSHNKLRIKRGYS